MCVQNWEKIYRNFIAIVFRDPKELVRLKIRLLDCISQFLATEVVDDFYSSAIKAKTQAHKSVSVCPSVCLSVWCLFGVEME